MLKAIPLLLGRVLAGCSSSPSPSACSSGEQCVQGAAGDVCRTTCLPDAGSPCPSGESCVPRSVCCTGTACTAALAQVCCPSAGC